MYDNLLIDSTAGQFVTCTFIILQAMMLLTYIHVFGECMYTRLCCVKPGSRISGTQDTYLFSFRG